MNKVLDGFAIYRILESLWNGDFNPGSRLLAWAAAATDLFYSALEVNVYI